MKHIRSAKVIKYTEITDHVKCGRWFRRNVLKATCIAIYQALIRPRNARVTVAQVPTCSKFTAAKLADYSKIVFVLYQIWCKTHFSNQPLLKIQELPPHFWRNPNLTDVNHSYSSPLVSPATLNRWILKAGLFLPVVQWLATVIGGGDEACKRLNKENQVQWDSSHSPCPLRAQGKSSPCGQPLDVISIAIFTGHGLSATLMPHGSSWVWKVPGYAHTCFRVYIHTHTNG